MPADISRTLIPAFPPVPYNLLQLAYARFPGGTEIKRDDDGRQAVIDTNRHLGEGQTLLYGAAFTSEGIIIIIDVLVQQRGKWYAFLVRPSTRIKERHLTDAALHDAVLRAAGIQVADFYLLLLDMQYVRHGNISPEELFIQECITRKLSYQRPHVRGRMQMLKRMAAKDASRRAYDAQQELNGSSFSMQPDAVAVQAEPVELQVDGDALRAYLHALQYPLYFMDFEAYQTPIPEYDGHWPFRQLPFQYSVHRLDEPGGILYAEGYIAPPDAEPVAAFGAALLQATGTEGTVIVYNIDSEKLILEQLQQDHPEWEEKIHALKGRLVDLMVPFSRGFIRIPSIGNKLSLKYILPAMVPEMSYASLVIGNGDDANQAYNAIRTSNDPAFIEATRAHLLAYCEVDTLAMVRILEKMYALAGE